MIAVHTIVENVKVFAATGDPCNVGGGFFFGFPKWYRYLDGVEEKSGACAVQLNGINDIWLIGLAIIEILLRVAIFAAVTYVLIGGFKYITSRANPDKTSSAKNTVVDGLIGLVIAIVATAVVSFVAGRFDG